MNGMPMNGMPKEDDRGRLRDTAKLFSWLLKTTGCRTRQIAYIVSLCAIMSVLSIIVPALIGRAVDCLTDRRLEMRALILLVTFNVFIAVLGNRQGIAISRLTQKIAHDLRRQLHAKLLRLPISYVDAHPHGDIMSRLVNDSENIVMTLSQAIPGMISSLITLFGCVIIMFHSSPSIALLNLTVGVVAMLPCSLLSKRIFTAAMQQQQALGALNATINDHFSRRRSILYSDGAAHACGKFSHVNKRFTDSAEHMQILGSIMEPMMSLIGSVAFVLTIMIGIWQIESGLLTIGMLQACLMYARQILRPFIDVGRTLSQLQGCLASTGRIREIMENVASDDSGTAAPLAADIQGEICFKDVTFLYMHDRPLFQGLNLRIPAGKTTAIIGETGAGKTTLFNLLLRFYQPYEGEILIDGIPVSNWKKRRLYGSIAVILQDQDTTADTVFESITYGCPGAEKNEAMNAVRMIHAEEIIASLPQGLATSITDDSMLSLGQQQLISMARVPLSNARIILLDEATSSVDSYSEKLIQNALQKIRDGRTCVVIAHRLSTIRNADYIVVMKDGQVAESGTHENLIALKGQYYDIVRKHSRALT